MDLSQVCLKRQYRVKQNGTLIIDQKTCEVNHSNDLDADSIVGTLRKNDKVRFYKIIRKDDGKLSISFELHPTRDGNREVIGGIINKQTEKTWEKSVVKVDNLYTDIRKRAECLALKKEGGLLLC